MPSKSIPEIIKKTMPAVVSIIASKHLSEIEKEIPQEYFPFLSSKIKKQREILRSLADSRGMVEVGGGSGFVTNEGGIIVTNRHVISDPKSEYTIITSNDQKFGSEVIACDPSSDVAVLRLKITPETKGIIRRLPSLKLGDSSKIELGEPILAIGNSLGLFRNTVSSGIISGLSRSIKAQINPESPLQEMRGLIQTDAAINPGNSGGPLINLEGYTIGINTAIVFGAENIGFAIPINTIKRDLNDLKKFGEIKRPLLGIRYMTIDEKIKDKLRLPVDYGSLIIEEDERTPGIIPGSPAEKARLREKDIILEYNDEKITKNKNIQDFLENSYVGEKISLKVLREKKEFKIFLILQERKI